MDEHRKTFPERVRSFVTRTLYLSPAEQAAEPEPEKRRLRPYVRRTLTAAGILLLVGFVSLVFHWAMWPYKAPEATGFAGRQVIQRSWTDADGRVITESWEREKKLWDWLELLIVPIVLAGGASWLNWSERKAERKIAEERRQADQRIADARIKAEREIAEDRQQEERLQAYFDKMTDLLLEKGLRDSQDEDEVRSIARTRTLTVLRTLDETRKGLVVRFLYEAGLIHRDRPIVSLRGTDLGRAELSEADLHGADLSETDLSEANLSDAHLGEANLNETNLGEAVLSRAVLFGACLTGAYLSEAHLYGADLCKAILSKAVMIGADLRGGRLSGAVLSGAVLSGAALSEAVLSGANLSGAILIDANLSRAILTGAVVTEAQLAQAASLEGATMPDGTVHD